VICPDPMGSKGAREPGAIRSSVRQAIESNYR